MDNGDVLRILAQIIKLSPRIKTNVVSDQGDFQYRGSKYYDINYFKTKNCITISDMLILINDHLSALLSDDLRTSTGFTHEIAIAFAILRFKDLRTRGLILGHINSDTVKDDFYIMHFENLMRLYCESKRSINIQYSLDKIDSYGNVKYQSRLSQFCCSLTFQDSILINFMTQS